MNKYYYDLHIHSCLSPCGDNDMTPGNIAGMAALKGLNIIALTDHNTCGNCPPFFKQCRKNGIVPVAGMELTTSEDIHMVCLFRNLENAMSFDEDVKSLLIKIPNRPDIFGEQNLINDDDEISGQIEPLLINATDIDIENAVRMVKAYGGVTFPAHIDREANGMISALGSIPPEYGFRYVEFKDSANIDSYKKKYSLTEKGTVTNSDAHYLWDINEAENSIMIDDEPYSSDKVRNSLIDCMIGEA